MNTNYFLKRYEGICSIDNPKSNHVTFIRNYSFTSKLKEVTFPLAVLAPKSIKDKSFDHIPDNVRFFFVDNVDYEFTILNNLMYKLTIIDPIDIMPTSLIHNTVILYAEGIKVAIGPHGEKIQFKHSGRVKIEDDVEIGPYTVIHKATIDMTIIKKGVKIGTHCNIGHNNIIGENTVFAAGVLLSGSVKVGKNCWLGTGSIVRNGISICDDVVIGTGAVVVKDITKPGIYVGNPAKYLKPKKDDWIF